MNKRKLFLASNLSLILFFSLIISAIPKFVFAQNSVEFVPGYYLTMNNDTVKAEIEFEYWVVSPNRVTVKELQNGEIKTFTSREISGFGVRNKKLEVDYHSINVELKYIQFPDNVIAYGKSPFNEINKASFFAKKLIKGEYASLYQMVDKYEKERFFIEKDENFLELEHFEYMTQKQTDRKIFRLTNDAYKQQLNAICSDAPRTLNKIPDYSEKSLKDYVLEYNACFTGKVAKVSNHEKTSVNFIVGVGVGNNKFFHPLLLRSEGNYNEIYPRAEIGLRVNFPNTFRTLFAQIDCNLYPNLETKDAAINSFTLYVGKTLWNSRKVQQRFFGGAADGGFAVLIGNGISYKKKLTFDLKTRIFYAFLLRFDFSLQYII